MSGNQIVFPRKKINTAPTQCATLARSCISLGSRHSEIWTNFDRPVQRCDSAESLINLSEWSETLTAPVNQNTLTADDRRPWRSAKSSKSRCKPGRCWARPLP